MSGSEDVKDGLQKTPHGDDQATTPLGTAEASGTASEQGFADSVLRALRGRYDILAEIGRGGMGIVYKARDRETDEVVALKVLKPEIASRSDVVERFKAELRLARKITHKNVCRTYELLRFDDTVVITMEYVEGESLRAFLNRYGSVPLRRGLEWAGQICDALGEAHAQGIVHRDLKPENVLIDRNGQAKVMDFGIARSIQTDATMTATLVGTPAYMSPEQAEGKPPDPRSDIYALGLMLYEMFVGQRAFSAETPVAYILMQIKEPPPPPRSVEPYLPGFLDRAIKKCLEKDPRKRFSSVAELQATLTEKPILEPKAPQLQLPPHLANSRRSDLVLLILGALGLAAFITLAPQITPETAVRIRLTRGMLLEKARNEMTRRGWKPTSSPWLNLETDRAPHNFLAERVGYAEARNALTREFPPYLFLVRFREPGNPNKFEGPSVLYEPDGSLRSLELPVVRWVPQGNGLPRPEAFELAKREVQQAFGVEISQLAPESEGTLSKEGRHGNTFQWVKREASGIGWHFQADVYDRITLLKRWNTLPENYRPREMSKHGIVVMVLWSILALVLFLVRRLFSQVRAREVVVLAAVGLASGGGLGMAVPVPETLFYFLIIPFFAVFGVVWFAVLSPTVTYVANRPWPHLAASYSALIQLRPAVRVTGLALVRGGACGLLMLGFYTVLLRFAVSTRLTWPQLTQAYDPAMNSIVPLVTWPGLVLGSAALVAYYLGFFLSVARRWISFPFLLAIIGGAVSLGFEGFTLPPDWVVFFLLFATGAAFSFVLVTFDMLTVLAAVFSFALWQNGYALTQMFETVGNWQYWFPFVLWAGVFAWAIFAGFRPFWDRFGRRLAEMFD